MQQRQGEKERDIDRTRCNKKTVKGLKAWTLAFVKRARAVQHDCVSCFFVIFYILLYGFFFVLVNCFRVFLFITIFLCVLCVWVFFSGCASLRFVPFLSPNSFASVFAVVAFFQPIRWMNMCIVCLYSGSASSFFSSAYLFNTI